MNSHQGNQSNASMGTYQYQIGDQVLEIPSNINYQLENIIAAGGGVQYILSDGSILVQKETKKDSNKNNFRRMIVLNQPSEISQASTVTTTQSIPTTQRIITQQIPSNGNIDTKNAIITNANTGATTTIQQNRSGAHFTSPMGPLTLTAEEYNELMQRRLQKQAEADAHQRRLQQEAQERAQQEAQQRAQQEAQQRAQQEAQQRAQQLHHQQQLQDHQNIAVQVQKIVQSLEEEVDGKKEDSEDIEMQLIAPKLEVQDIQGNDGSETASLDQQQIQKQPKNENEGKGAGRPFSCEQCGKKFLLKHHLTTHARVHTGERPHVCIHCGKDFAHKHCLNTHLLLHSTDRPYQCTECKKCFTLKHHLLTHSRVHSRSRPFVCTECGKTFSLKRHLVTHMKFHAGERPFVCDTCGESFAQEQHLVMHSRFHGSVDPFVCQDCGASFPRKFQLVNHGKLHGRVPHECTVCGQEFLQKRTLVAHMRQHTDAPHVCLECSEGFRTKSELTAHQRIVHNIQPPVRNKHAHSQATATATTQHQQQEDQIEHHQQEIEDDHTHYLKQEQPQYETVQISQDHQNYQIMVPSGSNSSTIEHKTIRIQQQQNVQSQHLCTQCGSCFNNREALNLHLRLHTGDKSLMTDLCALTAAIPGHIFQSGGNAYIEIDGGKYNITNGATIMANTGGSSPVPVQIITSANGQQVIEQVQSISPSLLQQQQHVTQQEVQIAQQQGQIVYTTVPQDSPVTQTVLVQQQQSHHTQQQITHQPQQQIIVHNQQHHPKPKTHFCQHCNKGFANKHGLQLHNKRHPSGECTVKSHICTECNRAFFQKNHLMLHQRQHMEHLRGGSSRQAVVITESQAEDGRTNGQEEQQHQEEVDEAVEDQKMEDAHDETGIDEITAASDNHSNEMRTQNVIVSNNNNNNIESDERATKASVVVQDGSLGSIQITTANEASADSSLDQGE